MKAIDAAAVEDLYARWLDSRITHQQAFDELGRLLATAIECEVVVAADDGLTVTYVSFEDHREVQSDIRRLCDGAWQVRAWLDGDTDGPRFLGTDGHFYLHRSDDDTFPTLAAARRALASALKAGAGYE